MRRGLTLATLIAMTGCAAIDDGVEVVAPVMPAAYRQPAPADLPRPASAWWKAFGSEELDRLQELALQNNRDHRAAIARVLRVQAQTRGAEAARSPTLDAQARADSYAPEGGPGSVTGEEPWTETNRLRLGLRASYEVDLWGRLRLAAQSARSTALASEHDRETVALSLTAQVALTYFEYLAYAERSRLSEAGVASRRLSLQGVQRRAEMGEATALEIERQHADLARAEVAGALHQRRRDQALHRLAWLVGAATPDLQLAGTPPERVVLPAFSVGSPAELLCRRPDIRRAEEQMRAAHLDVRSLRASMLPSLTISAEGGLGAASLGALGASGSWYYLAAAALTQRLFDGGRRQAQVEAAEARRAELVEQYAGTLLGALRDVDDALVARHTSSLAGAANARAHAAARAHHEAHRRGFEAGRVDRLELLLAEQRMLTAADDLEDSRLDRLRADVELALALGGGSRDEGGDPCVK